MVDFSASLREQGGIDAERKVIEVSGDGINNAGRAPSEACDEAVAKGIVITGLAITAHASAQLVSPRPGWSNGSR